MSTYRTDWQEGERLYLSCYESPDDDYQRLVFADWLEENGEPDWAQMIRLQIQIHQRDPHYVLDWSQDVSKVHQNSTHKDVREVVGHLCRFWGRSVLDFPDPSNGVVCPGVHPLVSKLRWQELGHATIWKRGFLVGARLSWEQWSAGFCGGEKHPPLPTRLETVEFSYRPTMTSRSQGDGTIYHLRGYPDVTDFVYDKAWSDFDEVFLSLCSRVWPGVKFTLAEVKR